jgi:nucleotide-binding universal stress UspA family protein
MITRVYVALDGSERARAAIAPAERLATACDAPLMLLSARWPDAEVDTVASASAEPGALVVMATRGRGEPRAAVLGSVADEVIRTACGPILLIGPHLDSQWRVPRQGSVLVGTDGSLDARHASEAAGLLAKSVGATVELLELMDTRDTECADLERRLATTRLRATATNLRSCGVPTSFELVDAFSAADVLLERLRTGGEFVLAVGSHGRSALQRAAFGSVTLRVVPDAPCPVLVAGPRWRTR